jgi:PPK2 family polyphosphate:nucleotide phosphotransferase
MSEFSSAGAKRLIAPYTVTDGRRFRLKDIKSNDTGPYTSKEEATSVLARGLDRLHTLQGTLYAEGSWSLLLVFQAMDAAGKDSILAHVMAGVNPQGCQVHSFKQPSSEELAHDFLWRASKNLPERGHIGIFNRSYYEEVLVVRVHPESLGTQRLPKPLVSKRIWKERFDDINAFERHLDRSGTIVRKFFLHVSKEEQRKRFLERLEKPDKNWKFSEGDVEERGYWHDYMSAYEEMIQHTATKHAPWYVVPADHKWFTRAVVASVIVDTLADLDLAYPTVDRAKRRELAKVRRALERERR